jgi:hypothetical protein
MESLMKKSFVSVVSAFLIFSMAVLPVFAQTIDSRATASVPIKGSPASVKRQLTEQLQTKVISNVLETAFGIKITPEVQSKFPKLVDTLGDAIRITLDPPDGENLSGTATIKVATAKLNEILNNLDIGSGAAAQKAKVVVSIDERMGLATANDPSKPIEVERAYSHDKSTFSDTSAKASGSQAASASSSSKNDVNYSASDSVAVAGRKDTAVAYQGGGGSAAGAQSTQFAGAQSTQFAGSQSTKVASAQSSEYAGAASSKTTLTDKSSEASASSSSSSFNKEQNNVQQRTDKVSITEKTKMASFDNAKATDSDGLVVARLGGEFQKNGLELVLENDLRAEGGRILPVSEIIKNGRFKQFSDLIKTKGINADVWATGTAQYNIVGTDATGTKCNGTLDVQSRFLADNTSLFSGALRANASGQGDQDCRANLALSLATSLASELGTAANKKLNTMTKAAATAAANKVLSYKLVLYTKGELTRKDRSTFTQMLKTLDGLQTIGDAESNDFSMTVEVTYPRALKNDIENLLDKLPWDKADVVGPKNNKICIGIEGKSACPNEFR